ncbi:31 kDa ribonucleoprotein, chloroplastic-like [Triticum aestivum]|uniref:31 kDa ribonucleoprotein, chloroplastic-like n=1 Tax=Triticum aestivum TaxID=4565 RepID=UPI001D01AFA3|nr:31 kDa ribonucleoprotein, chloroplastic-like [Triticum aestivum]
MAGYCGLLQGFLVSRRPPSGPAKGAGGGRDGPAAPDVVDISSDEEEEEEAAKGESGGADGDCVVLDSDPDGAVAVADEDGAAGNDGSSDELQIVAEKGQFACRDFPHSRHLCSTMPFGATSHEKHCTQCYCFVCDAPAPCAYWGTGLLADDHCHATDKETKWRAMRLAFKCKGLPASHPEKENLVYPTVVHPTVTSVFSRLSLANRSPLRNVVNQNQENHTSVRARLIVEPTACASRPHPATRPASGTSNVDTAQVTSPLEPMVSAPMPHPAIRAVRVTSNARTAQITQPVHPTVREPRANLATRAARHTSNGYTSQITHPVEQTDSAPRENTATRAARDVRNAHAAEIRYQPEPDWHEEDGEYMTEEEYARDGTKVYAGNLPYNISNRALALSFEHAGAVLSSKVIYNRETGQSRGFGFVTMSTVQEADRAVRIYHGYEVYGRRLIVRKAAPRGSTWVETPRRRSCHRFGIFVCNLPWQVDDSWLEELFSEHGDVFDARVVYERRGGTWRSRGFGFVTMATEEETYDAVYALNKQILEGRTLLVEVIL